MKSVIRCCCFSNWTSQTLKL